MPEQVIILPEDDGKQIMLDAVRSAQRVILMSAFRFSDRDILEELKRACERGVLVKVLLSNRAKGWRKKLEDLELVLRAMGADAHRYMGQVRKYHAKYLLVDDEMAFIMSFNYTKKCFRKTYDFGLVTRDTAVKEGLTRLFDIDWNHMDAKNAVDGRLILSPTNSRRKMGTLIESAERSLQIIDHKISDAQMVQLLTEKAKAGVRIEVLGALKQDTEHKAPIEVRVFNDALPHGKLMIIDGRVAVIGSVALSTMCLEHRRELSATTEDSRCVARLVDFFGEKFYRATTSEPDSEESRIPYEK